ncbi:hypothetical protein SAMN05216483_6784 [Streptomyces sp. 2131.1]|uniref:hypothetical protein n=1 Tax=Streptomyces sp. 2131.1 TaxID=1855346 RepID=UPI000896B277|nr:hypothetical protein [Streptomyces sp. 2131.1]SEE85026.1 hypothetical protein SAMN05216483_6784 [Streptomyces sp. 2131.1]
MTAEEVERLLQQGLRGAAVTEPLPPGAISAGKIPSDAIQTGDVLEDIRNREPYAVEAVILHALSEFSMGMAPMGKERAREWLSLYLQQVAEGRSPVDPGVHT